MHVYSDPPHHNHPDAHIVHNVYVVHHHHCLSIYSESDLIVIEGALCGKGVEQIETPGGEVEVVDQLDGQGETDKQLKESLF